MLGSFPSIVAAIALAIAAPLAHAQSEPGGFCGGQLTDQGVFFKFKQTPDFTVLTMTNNDNNISKNETYILYCNEKPGVSGVSKVIEAGLVGDSLEYFRIPLNKTMVDDTFTSTYIELIGQRNAISILSNPAKVVSPCLQKGITDKTITAMLDDGTQYAQVDAAFRMQQNAAQLKDIWMPHTVDIEPLYRADYIRAVSLFFNQGQEGQKVYDQIKKAYETHALNMVAVPKAFKRRIGWITYDLNAKHWLLRNSKFTKTIIKDAGGISFPLNGDSIQDFLQLTEPEVKLVILNSNVLIDQTEYPSGWDRMKHIRKSAGFSDVEDIPVLSNSMIFSLDYTRNDAGSSDYNYRVAGRPDLLLKDMIRAQYPTYQPTIGNFTFFNVKYGNSGTGGVTFNATDCGKVDPFTFNDAPYNNDNTIITVPPEQFLDYGIAPAPPTGGGMYGSYDGSEGKKSNVGIIVGVIVAAVVMAAGFAFAFFKWGKRAKEDRFIELEEEMNNEIPMH
ncbi:hypothetical protein BGZ82_008027 [Podila clonocystis]|nr:hypothetical protein BGZ82_008027 [Podila clonocystis]